MPWFARKKEDPILRFIENEIDFENDIKNDDDIDFENDRIENGSDDEQNKKNRKWCPIIMLLVMILLAGASILGVGGIFYLDYKYDSTGKVGVVNGSVTNLLVDETIVHGRVPLEYFFFVNKYEYFGVVWLQVSDYGSHRMNQTERLEVMEKMFPLKSPLKVYYYKSQPGFNLAVIRDYLALDWSLSMFKWIIFGITCSFLTITLVTVILIFLET